MAKSNKRFIATNWLEQQNLQQGFSAQQQSTIQAYWKNAGRKNLTNLLDYIALNVFNFINRDNRLVDMPIIFPIKGIYHPRHPDLIDKDLRE